MDDPLTPLQEAQLAYEESFRLVRLEPSPRTNRALTEATKRLLEELKKERRRKPPTT